MLAFLDISSDYGRNSNTEALIMLEMVPVRNIIRHNRLKRIDERRRKTVFPKLRTMLKYHHPFKARRKYFFDLSGMLVMDLSLSGKNIFKDRFPFEARFALVPSVLEWCGDSLSGPVFVRKMYPNRSEMYDYNYRLTFMSESDMIMFKLRWF